MLFESLSLHVINANTYEDFRFVGFNRFKFFFENEKG